MNNLFSATLIALSDFLLSFFCFPDLPSSFSLSCSLFLSLPKQVSSTFAQPPCFSVEILCWLMDACWNLFCPHTFECWIDESDRGRVQPSRRALRSQQGPLHGALGPRRDRAWRLRSQHRPKPWRKPSIGSGHNIHTVLFPITAALLSSDRNSQRVWDVGAPDTGLITGHDLRKSQGWVFGSRWSFPSLALSRFRYVFIGPSHIFIPYPSFRFLFLARKVTYA